MAMPEVAHHHPPTNVGTHPSSIGAWASGEGWRLMVEAFSKYLSIAISRTVLPSKNESSLWHLCTSCLVIVPVMRYQYRNHSQCVEPSWSRGPLLAPSLHLLS